MIHLTLQQKIALTRKSPRTAINLVKDRLHPGRDKDYPRALSIFVTERCNFSCPMCHVGASMEKNMDGRELTLEDMAHLIEQVRPWSPMFQLIGGEPTLFKPLVETVRLIAEKRMISGLTTNGLRLERFAEELVSAGLDFLAISLDGWDEESQFQRGHVKGSFDKIVHGIERAIQCRGRRILPVIRVATVITRNNFRDLEKIGEVVTALGVDKWSISHYFFTTHTVRRQQEVYFQEHGIGEEIWGDPVGEEGYLSAEDAEELRHILQKVRHRFGRKIFIDHKWEIDPVDYYSPRPPGPASRCDFPFNDLWIRGNGDIEMCQGYKLGNLKRDDLLTLWNGERLAYFRRKLRESGTMPGCFRCCALDIRF